MNLALPLCFIDSQDRILRNKRGGIRKTIEGNEEIPLWQLWLLQAFSDFLLMKV